MGTQKASPPKPLMRPLQLVSQRLRWQEGIRLTFITLSVGLMVTLLLVLSGRFYPLTYPVVLLAVGLGVTILGLLMVLAYVLLRPHSSLALARLLDRRLNLDERLTTALELATGDHATPLNILQAQRKDTLRRLKGIDPARVIPLHIPWQWLALVGVLVAAIAAGLMAPNPQVEAIHRRAKTEEAIAKQKAQFEEIRAEMLADETLMETPQGQELVQTLDELIAALEKDDLRLEEALAAISEAEQNLAKLQNETAQQATTLNDLAQTFGQFDPTSDLAEALKQGDFDTAAESLASAGNDLSTNPESAQELADALRQAAQAAEQAGDPELAEQLAQAAEAVEAAGNNPLADPQTKQELTDALQQASQLAEQAGNRELAETLNQAAEALASGQNPLADPQTRQELADALQQASQLAEQTGDKELAERLAQAAEAVEQAGNPEAAQQALQQAAEALEQAGQQLANQADVEQALSNIQEAREQLAEAGGQGEGQQPGRAIGGITEGEGLTIGGAGHEDPGPGAEGLTAEQGAPDAMSTDSGPNEGRTGEYEELYSPLHLGGEGGPIAKPDEQGVEGGIPIGDAPLDPHRDPSAAMVPYNQVYGQYADAASQALDESYIPLGMKGYIRHYFGALEPGE